MRISLNYDTGKNEPTELKVITDERQIYMIYEELPLDKLVERIILMMTERGEDERDISDFYTAMVSISEQMI